MDKPLNKRQLQHQKTLGMIRAAIDELVAEKGFDAMTIRDICERSDIKIGTFYHYFKSKNDILEDRYRRTSEHFARFNEQELKALPAAEALKAYTREFISYSANRVQPIFRRYYQVMLDERLNWQNHQPEGERLEDTLAGLIVRGQQEGQIRQDLDAGTLTCFYLACLNGLNFQALSGEPELYQDEKIRQLLDEMLIRLFDK